MKDFDPENRANWPIQVDPPGCGCTECIIGQYIPINRLDVSRKTAVWAFHGYIGNASTLRFSAYTDGCIVATGPWEGETLRYCWPAYERSFCESHTEA